MERKLFRARLGAIPADVQALDMKFGCDCTSTVSADVTSNT